MKKNKFEVGDLVNIITNEEHDREKYPRGTIYRIDDDNHYNIRFYDGSTNPYNESEIAPTTKLEKALL